MSRPPSSSTNPYIERRSYSLLTTMSAPTVGERDRELRLHGVRPKDRDGSQRRVHAVTSRHPHCLDFAHRQLGDCSGLPSLFHHPTEERVVGAGVVRNRLVPRKEHAA